MLPVAQIAPNNNADYPKSHITNPPVKNYRRNHSKNISKASD
jgi:hypothetical protein